MKKTAYVETKMCLAIKVRAIKEKKIYETYLSNVFSRDDAKLIGVLVVLDHVGQQGHHVHGEGQALRRIDDREVQEERES